MACIVKALAFENNCLLSAPYRCLFILEGKLVVIGKLSLFRTYSN